MNTQEIRKTGKRIVIVGGVAGGASAAARARRLSEEAEIILFERGAHISFANCGLPYHIGGVIAERARLLVQTPEAMARRFRIDVRTRTEVVKILPERREVVARNLEHGTEETVAYDELILSPGAEPIRPPLAGSDSRRVFTLRSLADMDAIKRVVDEEEPAHSVVIGGGYIGLEMAEALRERGVGVTLVELSPQVMGPADPEMAAPLHQQLLLHGVDLRLGVSVASIKEAGEAGRELLVELSTGETVGAGLLIMAIGVKPEVTLAREAGLKLGGRGGIAVDERMQTSDPHIYAVGDAVEVEDFVGGFATLIPLAGPANRQGRIAADNALGRQSAYHKTQGTAICKVFDLAIGMTGMSEKTAKRLGVPYEKIYIHPASHASYYPGASPLSLKLLFDPQSGKVLGAQAVGAEGVDKRIDVLAVAIRAGLTVYDLEDLELSYAPPYGSARDPINYAGFVAANVLRGDVALVQVEELAAPGEGQALLDVRTAAEVQSGTIPGAINIPLDELRERLGELPKDKELLLFCQVGLRGYLAARILTQRGFRVRNLSGGYKTFTMFKGALPKPTAPASVPPLKLVPMTNHELVKRTAAMKNDAGCCGAAAAESTLAAANVVRTIDACGLQCPGPIMRLAGEIKNIEPGQAIAILAQDPGFASDIEGWCHSTGNRLLSVTTEGGRYRATILKGGQSEAAVSSAGQASPTPAAPPSKKKTMVVFSSDFDRIVAAFIIANGAVAMGSEVTLFFTFWGLNVLRRAGPVAVEKTLIEKMFGWMMPRGPEKLTLSKMNMGGMGLKMIKGIMQKKKVTPLPELIESARRSGVRLVACSMSMDIMGIKREELIEGVELGGVAMYLDQAEAAGVNLFI